MVQISGKTVYLMSSFQQICTNYGIVLFVLPAGSGSCGTLCFFFFYQSENMYLVTLNVKINFKEFFIPHNPLYIPLEVPVCI